MEHIGEKAETTGNLFQEKEAQYLASLQDSVDRTSTLLVDSDINPLANAEEQMEQNYNMIDGVINNLPSPTVVQGYQITQTFLFDNGRGFAFGEHLNRDAFVTWQFTQEEGGQRDYYWGHYFGGHRTKALLDYAMRIDEYQQSYPVGTEKASLRAQLKAQQAAPSQNIGNQKNTPKQSQEQER